MTYEKQAVEEIKSALSYGCGDYISQQVLDTALIALEKQIPKKPRETRCALMCANCVHKITEKGCKKLNRLYCKKCGQAIDWSDTE